MRFLLEAAGFTGISQMGNHAKFIKVERGQTITAILPHYTELSSSTIASILRQAKIDPADLDASAREAEQSGQ